MPEFLGRTMEFLRRSQLFLASVIAYVIVVIKIQRQYVSIECVLQKTEGSRNESKRKRT